MKFVVRSPVWQSSLHSCEGEICLVLGSLPMWSKSPNCEGSLVERCKIRVKSECAHFVRNIADKREREEEKKSLRDFRTSTRDRFSDYNCRFVHCWIGLILDKRFGKRDTSFCTVGSSIRHLSKEISASQFMFCFLGLSFSSYFASEALVFNYGLLAIARFWCTY